MGGGSFKFCIKFYIKCDYKYINIKIDKYLI